MCQLIVCPICQKKTWDGCGKHIEECLKDVPENKRCHCKYPAAPRPIYIREVGGLIIDKYFELMNLNEDEKRKILYLVTFKFYQGKVRGINYWELYQNSELNDKQKRTFLTHFGYTNLVDLLGREAINYASIVSDWSIEKHENLVKMLYEINCLTHKQEKKNLYKLFDQFSSGRPEEKELEDNIQNWVNVLHLGDFTYNKKLHSEDNFYCNRSMYNFVFSSLKTAETHLEKKCALKAWKAFIYYYFSYIGLDLEFEKEQLIEKKEETEEKEEDETEEDNNSFVTSFHLPKLPRKWGWNKEFVKNLRMQYHAEQNVCYLEYCIFKCKKIKHHKTIISKLDDFKFRDFESFINNCPNDEIGLLLFQDLENDLLERTKLSIESHEHYMNWNQLSEWYQNGGNSAMELIVKCIREDGRVDICGLIGLIR